MCYDDTGDQSFVVFHKVVVLLQVWQLKDLVYKRLVGKVLIPFIKAIAVVGEEKKSVLQGVEKGLCYLTVCLFHLHPLFQ